MTLDQWLISNKRSAEEFARELGCSGEAVRNWRNGSRRPDADTIERIGMVTDGAVTAEDMHQTRLAFLKSSADASNSPEAA